MRIYMYHMSPPVHCYYCQCIRPALRSGSGGNCIVPSEHFFNSIAWQFGASMLKHAQSLCTQVSLSALYKCKRYLLGICSSPGAVLYSCTERVAAEPLSGVLVVSQCFLDWQGVWPPAHNCNCDWKVGFVIMHVFSWAKQKNNKKEGKVGITL